MHEIRKRIDSRKKEGQPYTSVCIAQVSIESILRGLHDHITHTVKKMFKKQYR